MYQTHHLLTGQLTFVISFSPFLSKKMYMNVEQQALR